MTYRIFINASNRIVQRQLALPGGVLVSLPTSGPASWSYPDFHGNVIASADATGVRTGNLVTYDPFGQPLDGASGDTGTAEADDSVVDNMPSTVDYAWVGQHQKLYEHADTLSAIEMGARVYLPSLGRFLSADPVEGGVENAYVYPLDPVNTFDLSGQFAFALAPLVMLGAANSWNPVGVTILAVVAVAAVVVWAGVLYREKSAHGARRQGERGISDDMVEQTIQNGKKSSGGKGKTVYDTKKIRVVVDNKTGRTVSAIRKR